MFGLLPPQESIFQWLYSHLTNSEDAIVKGGSPNFVEVYKWDIMDAAIPNSFDARDEWPNCIHGIRNQGNCGACWAFSSAAMLEDRFCIETGGAIDVTLAP